jgi:hypothetical protein
LTTSGTTSWNPIRDKVIYGALRICGAYNAANIPRPEQLSDATDALDMMLKSWAMDGFLWLKKFIYVKLVAAQKSYTIGVAGDTVTIGAADNSGAYLQRPTRVFFPTRYTIATTSEVPMTPISRQEYALLPNKATPGMPVQVYYDPQVSTGVLYVWPVPSGATDKIILTVDRILEDVGADDTTFDLPPEALEMLKFNLALRLAPEYALGMAQVTFIEKYAIALKAKLEGFQQDNASTFFQPAYRGR